MVQIYYHIYAIDGVESIIDEQLSLIKKYINVPYTLNIGVSIALEDVSIEKILNTIYKHTTIIRDIRGWGNEFVTIDLIENDKENFGDSDYILYIHTKGASKLNNTNYSKLEYWRHFMNYFNIEKCIDVFKIFEKSDFNTYGVHYISTNSPHYSGNFWWAKSSYLKTIETTHINKKIRFDAEVKYLPYGKNWNPYSAFNPNLNLYTTEIKREQYAI